MQPILYSVLITWMSRNLTYCEAFRRQNKPRHGSAFKRKDFGPRSCNTAVWFPYSPEGGQETKFSVTFTLEQRKTKPTKANDTELEFKRSNSRHKKNPHSFHFITFRQKHLTLLQVSFLICKMRGVNSSLVFKFDFQENQTDSG